MTVSYGRSLVQLCGGYLLVTFGMIAIKDDFSHSVGGVAETRIWTQQGNSL